MVLTSSIGGICGNADAAVYAAAKYQPSWAIEDVDAQSGAIRDVSEPVTFPVVPDGHAANIRYRFGMAKTDGTQ